MVALEIRVHEADFDAVLVEEGGCEGGTAKNHLQIVNTLAVLLEANSSLVANFISEELPLTP